VLVDANGEPKAASPVARYASKIASLPARRVVGLGNELRGRENFNRARVEGGGDGGSDLLGLLDSRAIAIVEKVVMMSGLAVVLVTTCRRFSLSQLWV